MTYRQLLCAARDSLKSAGNESPDAEARMMLFFFLGADRLTLIDKADEPVDKKNGDAVLQAVRKRSEGYPLQYIFGKWEFMGIPLCVGEGVLIPRDDTEVCVRECISLMERERIQKPRIIELCSGSGAISLALAERFPESEITAVELSDKAYDYLCRNIALNGAGNIIKPVKADVFIAGDDFADGSFDVLISNPPYVETGEIPLLQKEVGFEPAMALDGGSDGLDFYRCISEKWLKKLKKGGIVSLETGENQGSAVSALLKKGGVSEVSVIRDIAGLERCTAGIFRQ